MADETPQDSKGKGKAPADDSEKMDPTDVAKMLRALGLTSESLPGAIVGGKKQKEMSSYKFWQTQPVPTFDEAKKAVDEEGPMKEVDISKVPKEPPPIPESFEWYTMDMTNDEEVSELYELLTNHYIEDDQAMFRFHYSKNFFNWALKAPGWKDFWHVGVRARANKKLVACIFGVPIDLRIRAKTFRCAEVNYLCVHKKLRSKRLAPVMIREITRRFNLEGIYQAIYTAGIVLPSPVSTCRYFHRTLDFDKLYEVGFSRLPQGVSPARQRIRFRLPNTTSIDGFREMEPKDIVPVGELLAKSLQRFDMAQVFSAEEIDHWLLHREGAKSDTDRVVWTYVVEKGGKITDFVSYYKLESTIIKQQAHNHKVIRAAYLYYYATEAAFQDDQEVLKKRLNELVKDALIMAKKNKFDVVNALSLMDNPLFLEEQRFGPGDGQLHYYLYNYRASPIAGGVDDKNNLSLKDMGGIGMVML